MFHGIPTQGSVSSSLALPASRPHSPSRHPARLDASRLPPEIWLAVFVYATWDSEVFFTADRHDVLAKFAIDKYGVNLRKNFHAAMRVNRSVSLVCKTWNTLVQDNMFKYILVRNGAHAIQIATALEHHKSSAGNARRPGWWTIRLEVSIRYPSIWTVYHTNALTTIIKNCPNLVVFSTSYSTSNVELFSPALIYDLPKCNANGCLRRLELKGDASLILEVVSMLASSLEILRISPSRVTSVPKPRACHLSRLHTFITTFGLSSNISTGWNMPSLRTLIADYPLELIQRVGRQLRYLSIPHEGLLRASLSLCPNLHELFMNCNRPDTENLFDGIKVHSSLRCIIFHRSTLLNYDPGNDKIPTTSASYTSLRCFFPSLECIRFQLSEYGVPLNSHVEGVSLNRCHAQGITVQYRRAPEYWLDYPDWQPLPVG
jgi:hypothetical protein